jgi:hypothetical protein
MSVHQIFAQSDAGPAEFDYTNPDVCVVCGAEHDLDEDTGRNIVEGWIDGDFVVCDHCDLYCACGDSVLEWGTEPCTKSTLFLKAGTIIRDGEAICLNCEKEAILGQWHEATGGQYARN